MKNVQLNEFQFKGDIVSSTFKKHYLSGANQKHQSAKFIVFESRLSDKIIKEGKSFNKQEIF